MVDPSDSIVRSCTYLPVESPRGLVVSTGGAYHTDMQTLKDIILRNVSPRGDSIGRTLIPGFGFMVRTPELRPQV